MLNRIRKIAAAVVLTASLLALTSCGSKGAVNATYGTIYDSESSEEVMDTLPEFTMIPVDIASSLEDGSRRYEVTLDLESTGDYTLIFDYYDPSVTDEEAADYFRYEVAFIGTYEKEDDNVTLGAAEIGQVTYTAGSDYTSSADSKLFSYDGSGDAGVWYSDDDESILDMFGGGIVTVEDEQVTGIFID